ncbi:hypothetical protein [Desulforhopalus singaporensis]|uniref:Uncharacterized protein n=1 Tax=Desulforhopalus singaporensis TaxID=91360 RepID=A0A1H0IXS1_9BACT|nr:hypothetical protein [Desulforhopalus singaporensis]SDO36245.1 hypothetical protein SAMN05660330_00068 [Desulforhopalus singaporensis]
MIELIVVKAGDDYFRFTQDGFTRCSMNKASVYPLDHLDQAIKGQAELKKAGLDGKLMKLVITEEPFEIAEEGE